MGLGDSVYLVLIGLSASSGPSEGPKSSPDARSAVCSGSSLRGDLPLQPALPRQCSQDNVGSTETVVVMLL